MSITREAVQNLIVEAQKSLPVNIVSLCNSFGIRVYEVESWAENSGMIKKNSDGDSYSIYVNATHSKARRRFTIAHELAHWILHRDIIGDGILDDGLYRSGLPTPVEVEANRFAADILMPKLQVNEEWQKPDCDLECMASIFGVSRQAMAIRLGLPL